MREKILLSQKHINKESILNFISKLGEGNGYRIETSGLYNLNDIDLYIDVSEEEYHLMGFRVIEEDKFARDTFQINGKDYANLIFISHDSDITSAVNKFIRQLLSEFPVLIITDESYDGFYFLEDIESGKIPEWLKI